MRRWTRNLGAAPEGVVNMTSCFGNDAFTHEGSCADVTVGVVRCEGFCYGGCHTRLAAKHATTR